jgi:hypothetical protein
MGIRAPEITTTTGGAPANQSNHLTPPQILTKVEDVVAHPRKSVHGQEMSADIRTTSISVTLAANPEAVIGNAEAEVQSADIRHLETLLTPPLLPRGVANIIKRGVSGADPEIGRRRAGSRLRRRRNEKCKLAWPRLACLPLSRLTVGLGVSTILTCLTLRRSHLK